MKNLTKEQQKEIDDMIARLEPVENVSDEERNRIWNDKSIPKFFLTTKEN